MFLSASLRLSRRLIANRWVQVSAGAIASVGLAYAAMNAIAWPDVADVFRTFPVGRALLSLIPLAAAMALRTARWAVLLRGEPASFSDIFLTQNTGIGLNNLLPVRMVSEPVQLTLITRRYQVLFPKALATLVAGNVLDIFATAMLLVVGIALVPGLREGRIGIHLFGAFIMVIVSTLVLIAVSRGIDAVPIFNRMDFFHRLMVAVDVLRHEPGRLWVSFGTTIAHWFALGVAGSVLASGLDFSVDPLTMATVLVAATFFTSAIPPLPGGMGTYHFAIISMLTAMGVDTPSAFSFSVVMHLFVVLPPSGIALAMLPRVGSAVLRRVESPQGAVQP